MHMPTTFSNLQLQDGRELSWEGFFVGHRVLTEDEITAYAHRLLETAPPVVTVLAAQELSYYHASGTRKRPSLLLHSATRTIKCFEGDVEDLIFGRGPRDLATFLETRSVYLGTTGDLTVGRTHPWSEAARLGKLQTVNIEKLDYYYLSHALLEAAAEHAAGIITPLTEVIAWLRQHPDAVIRLYALDLETQIFLLWLRREAGLQQLWIDANKPVVNSYWNRKSHIHPTVSRARELDPGLLSANELLVAEQQESEAFRKLGLALPVLPGYTIPRTGASRAQFVTEVLEAADLLRRRYSIPAGALKPSESGEGARIMGDIDLGAKAELTALAEEAYAYGDDYLLEAWVEFLQFTPNEITLPVAPSGHFRYGRVAEGLTLQTLDQYCWNGNAFVDEAAWGALGLPMPLYHTIRQAMRSVHGAFSSQHSVTDGSYGGLVTGGIDFAVGRVGGGFGDRILVGAIDFNLSSNGGEYMRVFRDEVLALGLPEQYVATRGFRPTGSATLEQVETAVKMQSSPTGLATIVVCVPGRWGMLAVTGTDLPGAMKSAQYMVSALVDQGLATV